MKSTKLAMTEFNDLAHWVEFVLAKVRVFQSQEAQLIIEWNSEVSAMATALMKISEIHDRIKDRIKSNAYSKKDCKKHIYYNFYKHEYQRFMHTHWRLVAEYRMNLIESYQSELNKARRQTRSNQVYIEPDNHVNDHRNITKDSADDNPKPKVKAYVNDLAKFINSKYKDGTLKIADDTKQFIGGGFGGIKYNNGICIEYNTFIELITEYDPDLISDKYSVFNIFDDLCKAGYGKKRFGLSAITLPWVCRMGGDKYSNTRFFQFSMIIFRLYLNELNN